MIVGVTTFSQSIFNRYGYKLLETARKHWPGKLVIYLETVPLDIDCAKFEYRKLFDIPGMVAFLQHIQAIPLALGKTDKGYNYNYDAWKFSRKAFCQWDMAIRHSLDQVFWLDADIQFTQDVPKAFLEGLFHGEPMVFLGRRGFYTETGFVGFDVQKCQDFFEQYRECYQRGILFSLPRWHDCQALDWARAQCGIDGRNLSPFYQENPEELEVFSRTELAEYMTHDKGPAKNR